MKQLLTTVLSGVARWVLKSYRRISLDLLQIEAAVWYVRGVGAVRQFFLGGVVVALLVSLAIIGFLLLHLGIYALLPAPLNAMLLVGLGAFYLIAALLALRWAFAEKTWLKYSQANEIVARATAKKPSIKP